MEGRNPDNFLKGPSKVTELIEFLDGLGNQMKETQKDKQKEPKPLVDISADVTDSNYFISGRTISTYMRRTKPKIKTAINMNEFTFMRQIDQKNEDRSTARLERERVASNFRRQGNYEYRRDRFENAIKLYTKGLEYIVDTPVLYINRACCYLKLRKFQRAVIDCNHVLTKLDPKNLRALLYRAAAYKRINDHKNFEESIYQAKQLNSKDMKFIDNFLIKMRTSL